MSTIESNEGHLRRPVEEYMLSEVTKNDKEDDSLHELFICDVTEHETGSDSTNVLSINNKEDKQQQESRPKMQLQQAPTGNQRGRSSVRSRRIRSHSICNNKIIKKDSMIQLALANWSDLFQPRRSRSLDSRVNPKGDTAAPQRAQNAPPLLSQSPTSPPSIFSVGNKRIVSKVRGSRGEGGDTINS